MKITVAMQPLKLLRTLLTFVLLLSAAPLSAAAQQAPRGETTIQAIGGSRVRGGDLSAAREEAVNAGLVAAVHRVLAELLPPETLAGNFQAINEAVLHGTDRFVRDYKVLAQSSTAASYRALVQATVSVDRIQEALRAAGIRLEARQYPRVLFCIAETQIHELAPRYWWDGRSAPDATVAGSTLARRFSAEGFDVARAVAGAVGTGYPPELRGTQAVALGREFKAEVVVAGPALAETAEQPGSRDTASVRGTITLRAYRVADGELIAQTQRAVLVAAPDPQSGGRDALDRAAAMAAEDLIGQIDAVWFRQMAAGRRIEMVVHGISGHMAHFVRFRGALGNLSGVERMHIREMQPDAAILSVDYQGHSRALADALLLLPFETFRVAIAHLEENAIQLQLVPR